MDKAIESEFIILAQKNWANHHEIDSYLVDTNFILPYLAFQLECNNM